jgi:hypothetical protein
VGCKLLGSGCLRAFAPLLLAALVAATCGCSDPDEQWRRSRDAFCTEVHFAKEKTLASLSRVRENLSEVKVGQAAASQRELICAEMRGQLNQAGEFLAGFEMSTHILARGRGEDESVEAAGLVTNNPSEPISRGELEVYRECSAGSVENAKAAVDKLEAEVTKRLDDKLALCTKHGWKF